MPSYIPLKYSAEYIPQMYNLIITPAFRKILTTTALCLAAMGVSSCSWRWPSLHTAEAVLHCDKQVVVCITEPGSIFKYRYKGLDWYPIKLARAIDKGKSIYRRGDGAAWCIQNTTDRYQILQESVRTCMVPRVEHCTTRVNGGMRFDQAIMEQDFPALRYKVWACPIPGVEKDVDIGIRESKRYSIAR